MTEQSTTISTIIVTHNSAKVLAGCLDSLLKASQNISHELIIVDNQSDDLSVEISKELWSSVRVIENKDNRGFAAACNQGAKIAHGNFLLFLNPDVLLYHDSLTALIDAAQNQEKIGLLAGRMVFHDKSFQPTCRRFPTFKNMLFSRQSFLAKIFGSQGDYTLPDYDQITKVDAVAGTLLMVKKELFEALGCFDERFFMYMEDTDLSLRAVEAGFVNYFVPQAGGIHGWGEGSTAGWKVRAKFHHRSVLLYFRKHQPGLVSSVLLPLLLRLNLVLSTVRKSIQSQ